MRLLSIAPSNYVEKARWGLQRHGVDFHEERHVPMFHWRHTKPYDGRRTVPLLDTGSEAVLESTDILRWADAHHPTPEPLWPDDPALAAEVDALCDHYDAKVGPHARKAAYGVLLGSKQAVLEGFRGSAGWELTALSLGFPIWRGMMVRGLNVVPEKVARSRGRLEELFAEAGERLADSDYLVGDRFTAADLTFASHGALVVLPEQYGGPLPDLEALAAAGRLPGWDEARTFRDRMRETVAGRHVMRLYAEERGRVLA